MASKSLGAVPVLCVDAAPPCAALDEGDGWKGEAWSGEGWAVLHDQVVVYTTRLGADGEPETTLVAWPGARVRVRLERCGGPCAGVRLADAVVEDEGGGEVRRVRLSASRAAPVLADGRPVRVADLPTIGCPLPALSRHAMLRWLWRRLAPAVGLEDFRALLHEDRTIRSAAISMLRRGLDTSRGRPAPAG